ncbi:coiled-coil domain-containing protein 97 isoform X2 [Danio aesculapii]|uniref:coiled-coil domain-containing protein 97 isoform X2 n=1 Tax=Danio aesculapii TaxID=1142201 RepID=UPI0024C042C8|nr:coiled-coil domain-containing protein 97 isoform X2 [Danio aesculapii]
MWGEIEPCVKGQEIVKSRGTDQRRTHSPDPPKTVLWGEIEPSSKPDPPTWRPAPQDSPAAPPCPPKTTAREVNNTPSCSADLQDEPSSSLSSMIETIAGSGSPVKSQQLGDPDLTLEEKREVLMDQYRSRPLVFLERYQAHLKPEHIDAFSHLSSDCRVQYYCKEIQRRVSGSADRRRVRNHRYAALRALQKEGQYFSEEQMRVRDPLLYEQYIGQYLSEDEILQRSEEAMRSGTGGLADLLINSYQEKLIQSRLEQEQEKEQCALEESEDEECEEVRQVEYEPDAEEKAMLREEFLSQMHQRFLDGKDDFNYSEVDENPDYDNLDIVSRDAEERYFDEDDEEEEEEEEEEQEEMTH